MSTHSIRNVAYATPSLKVSKHLLIGVIMLVALFAFEIFNFDTTRFALDNLLGGKSFVGLKWATILAVAFCAIDFAGLARIFTPEQGLDEPKEVWYLMGAWLLGATMNAIMTWWAVSLTLLNNEFGNEILSRQQLLNYVPVFVAVLVWLTRILFIGAISVAGDHLLQANRSDSAETSPAPTRRAVQPQHARQSVRLTPTDKPQYRPTFAEPVAQQAILLEEEFEPETNLDIKLQNTTVRRVSRPQARPAQNQKQPRAYRQANQVRQPRPAAAMQQTDF